MAITMDIALDTADWLPVLLGSRLVTALISILAVGALRLASPRDRGAGQAPGGVFGNGRVEAVGPAATGRLQRRRVAAMLLLAGSLDVVGLISFAIGLSNAPTWLVGLASSFGPAVTIIVAVVLMGERLRPIQWFGLVGIAAGMVAIGLP